MVQISNEIKIRILALHDIGLKQVEISKKLNINQISVSRIIQKKAKTESTLHLRCNGRPNLISSKIDALISKARSKHP